MSTSLEYTCRTCGEIHHGLPAWHFAAPDQALAIPERERASRVALTADDCVIDGSEYYLKGLLEVPVRDIAEPFLWGVWLSVSQPSYRAFTRLFGDPARPAGESLFGWLCNAIPGYPETSPLKAHLNVREYPMRPWVELEPTEHPLSVDHREGMTWADAVAMAERLRHFSGA